MGISPNLQLGCSWGQQEGLDVKVTSQGQSETRYGQISTLGDISYKLLVGISVNSQLRCTWHKDELVMFIQHVLS